MRKIIYLLLIIVSSVFIFNVEAIENTRTGAIIKAAEALERQALINNCHAIYEQRRQAHMTPSECGNGKPRPDVSWTNAFKSEVREYITAYLNSVGSPEALKLLNDLGPYFIWTPYIQ